ncbi:hypothetical protein [Shewanella denitrificans]|uniref:hypothetical protein n=1 Tax=Shewanella denitrificans TaxID=192073 RepID=UPI0012FA50F0|nr:hypothetical protein [Shewanella denitrificans]
MKHCLIASFYASLTSALALIIIALPDYSGASILFGLFAFPVAFICSVALSYPLIYIRSKLSLKKWQSGSLFAITGLVLGGITPILILGSVSVDVNSIVFIMQYSFIGFVASSTAWYYVQHNVAI